MRKCLLGFAAFCGAAYGGLEDLPSVSTHEGWYLGAGIDYQHTTLKIKQSDYFGQVMAATTKGRDGYQLANPGSGSVGGSLVGGYGAFVSGCFYIGGELVLDIASDNEHSCEVEDDRFANGLVVAKVSTKVVGFVPGIAVRLGYFADSIDTLFYVTAGGSYVETKVNVTVEDRGPNPAKPFSVSLNKKGVVPSVGVGIEKGVGSHFNVRLEGVWRFSSDKEASGDMGLGIADSWFKCKSKSDGYAIRLIGSYVF